MFNTRLRTHIYQKVCGRAVHGDIQMGEFMVVWKMFPDLKSPGKSFEALPSDVLQMAFQGFERPSQGFK